MKTVHSTFAIFAAFLFAGTNASETTSSSSNKVGTFENHGSSTTTMLRGHSNVDDERQLAVQGGCCKRSECTNECNCCLTDFTAEELDAAASSRSEFLKVVVSDIPIKEEGLKCCVLYCTSGCKCCDIDDILAQDLGEIAKEHDWIESIFVVEKGPDRVIKKKEPEIASSNCCVLYCTGGCKCCSVDDILAKELEEIVEENDGKFDLVIKLSD